jgi:pre-mRNA-splicing helicase BRR2
LFFFQFFCLDNEIDETYGVNVEFEGSSDEDDGDNNEIREDEEGDQSEGEEAKTDYTIHDKNLNKTVI